MNLLIFFSSHSLFNLIFILGDEPNTNWCNSLRCCVYCACATRVGTSRTWTKEDVILMKKFLPNDILHSSEWSSEVLISLPRAQ